MFSFSFSFGQCAENKELQERICTLEKQLASFTGNKLSVPSEQGMTDEFTEELKKKVQSQVINCFQSIDFNSHL